MPASIPVLCYHDVSRAGGHTPEVFEEHLAAIRDMGFSTVSATTLVRAMRGEIAMPERACVLTFDDCHLSNWTLVAPLLVKYDMCGVFFCVTDFIGQGRKRGQAAPDSESGEGGPELMSAPDSFRLALERGDFSQFLNEAELTAMVRDYGFEVFAHSSRHQGCFRNMVRTARLGDAHAHWSASGIYPEDLRQEGAMLFEHGSAYAYNGHWPLPPATPGALPVYRRRTDAERLAFCREDFRRSLERMAAINKAPEQYFCWPWGQFDAISEQALRETGFTAAFTLERSANVAGGDVMRIHRVGVGKTKNGAWVQSRLAMYASSMKARVFFKYLRKRPEVASVVYMTDSDKFSGGSRQMYNNVLGMQASGLRVTAVVPPGSAMLPALRRLAEGDNPMEVVEFGGFRQYVRAASFVRGLAERVGADVVHTFHSRAYKSAALAKLLGARFRLFINRGVIFPPNAIFALYALAAQGVVCNSRQCAEVLRRYRVQQKKLLLAYNSFIPEEGGLPPERTARKKRGARVLFLGNLAPAKGFDVFAQVAEELVRRGVRDLEYVVAGVRPEEDWKRFVPASVLPRLNLLGELPHAEVLRELLAADMLVIPSRQESLPNTLLEAFACSLPVVGTRVGGIPELIRHGVNGLLADSGDIAALADHVAALALDPPLRLHMGRVNRTLVARHLDNAAKSLTLLRLYSGERLFEALPIEDLARQIAAESGREAVDLDAHDTSGKPGVCPHHNP